MAQQNDTILKSYFETGDTPTQSNFEDLIDSKTNKNDIVDDLISTDTDKPLSANQGKQLQDNKINVSDIDDTPADDADVPVSSKWVYDNLYNALSTTLRNNIFPSGMIQPSAAASMSGWLLCNGQTVGNAGSGADNAGSEYETLFDILKSGWENAGTEVFANGDTVKLPDLRGMFLRGAGTAGTKTMANGSVFDGGSVGDYEADKYQDHKHKVEYTQATGGSGRVINDTSASTYNDTVGAFESSFVADESLERASNGTPRVGDETKPASYSVNYFVKV